MSFYTIDGRFVNKKNVVEGFFDNRVIEHATIGIDNQDTPNESIEEITTLENSMPTENATAMEATATNESTEEITTLENSMPTENATAMEATATNENTEEITTLENSMPTENATAMEATAINESAEEITTLENSMPTENATSVNEIAEIPMTDEMKEDKSLHMHFCINGKCLTGNELRKLNELYDKKCIN